MSLTSLWRERPLIAGRWTLKDAVQGRIFGHPSHPMFVHFPAALFPTAFAFDVISRIEPDLTLPRAAAYNIIAALVVTGAVVLTGLVDYLPMVGGSRKKQAGTYHLIGEVLGVALMAGSLAVRLGDWDADRTPLAALLLAGAGTLAMIVGNWFGGYLVYRQGMRVSTEL